MTRLYLALPGARAHLAQSRALLGFDAFIDIVARPLREGSADGAGQAFNLLPDFGAFVSGRAGVSGSVELDERTTKMGGNAPNVATALGALGVAADCVIPCGPPDPLFAPLAARGRLFSTGEPGLCVALEFLDGKLLLGVNRGVNRLTWAQVTERVGLNTLIGLAEGGGAICFLNWGELPGGTDLLRGLARDVLPALCAPRPLLVDLCDCARRGEDALRELLGLLSALPNAARVVLSLNGNEQRIVRRALGLSDSLDDLAAAAEIRQTLGLWRVALHARAGCQMASADGVCHLPTPAIVERPAILTGAGDAFNAGLCAALLLGWDDELCLALASKVAGHYVARGEPPRIEQLIPQ